MSAGPRMPAYGKYECLLMVLKLICRVVLVATISILSPILHLAPLSALAQTTAEQTLAEPASVPNYWDPRERVIVPDLSTRNRLRFLTTHDFPPFNFIDQRGRVSGFQVDLAREICRELDISDKCQVQMLPWEELAPALASGQGDALIAGIAVNEKSRDDYLFTRPFIKFPARFIRKNNSKTDGDAIANLTGKRIGVQAGSAHEALLRAYFPDMNPVTYEKADWVYDGLKSGEIDAAFGDGVHMSFWLASKGAADCCSFVGGPYFAPAFLGEGLTIAVPRESADLVDAFDHAIHAISSDGRMRELYLQYFPNGLY